MEKDPIKRSKIILISSVSFGFFVMGVLISMMPPFYPSEAEKKGAKPSQYGLVFGILSLAAFLSSPFIGRLGNSIGPKQIYIVSGIVLGITVIAFTTLDFILDADIFIGMSYLLRILQGVSEAAIGISILSILNDSFRDQITFINSLLRTSLGLGYMMGPVIGSLLYSAGGFGLPFLLIGIVEILFTLIQIHIVPKSKLPQNKPGEDEVDNKERERPTHFSLVQHPSMILPFLDISLAFSGVGMLESMLEVYLKNSTAQASQTDVSLVFFILGLSFVIATLLSGYVSQRFEKTVLLSIAGNSFMTLCHFLIGPAPFLNMEPSVKLASEVIALQGVGLGIITGSSFGRAYRTTLKLGFMDGMPTYLLLSALWTSSLHLGTYFGSTSAGFMVEKCGFRNTTMFFCGLHVLMIIINLFEIVLSLGIRYQRKYEKL